MGVDVTVGLRELLDEGGRKSGRGVGGQVVNPVAWQGWRRQCGRGSKKRGRGEGRERGK